MAPDPSSTAEPGDYAPVVLLPGDPNRATRIAARFDGGLDAARLVNANRGLLGYTGTVDGVPVSVQTTMMGTPTTTIVMEELLNLGVTTFIRVGTTRRLRRARHRRCRSSRWPPPSLSGIGAILGGGEPTAPTADFEVVQALVEASRAEGPDDARRAGRHLGRVLRPAPGRRRPLGRAGLPVGGDGDRRGVPARDARARRRAGRSGPARS